jgi:hypothetical protein
MVQVKWAETLAAGLLCTGLALGQSSDRAPNADLAPNSVVTFRETGKADRKCKVVRRWRDDRGRWAYELETLDSHEHQVIYEPQPVSSAATGQSEQGSSSTKSAGAPAAPLSAPPGANYAITPAAMASQTAAMPASGSQTPAATSSAGAMEAGLVEHAPADNEAPDTENSRRGAVSLMGLLRDRMHQVAQNGDNGLNAPPGIPANEPNAFSQPVRQARFPGLHRTDESSSPYAGSSSAFSLLRQRPAQPMGYVTQSAAVSAKSASTASANAAESHVPLIPVPNVNPQDTQQLIGVLQNAGYPSQREWAAEMLAQQWTSNAEIVPALALASRQDPAASVRKACATCLAKIQKSEVSAARYNDRPHQ